MLRVVGPARRIPVGRVLKRFFYVHQLRFIVFLSGVGDVR
jgi:hypothetical protein